MQNGINTVRHRHHVFTLCLPDVTTCDQISIPLPYLLTSIDQILEVGTAWKEGCYGM